MRNIGLNSRYFSYLSLTLLVTDAPAGMSDAAWLNRRHWFTHGGVVGDRSGSRPCDFVNTDCFVSTTWPSQRIKEITAPYAHPVIYLLFGGFIIATALERWNLHRRLALECAGSGW